jgi:hypothetical protein
MVVTKRSLGIDAVHNELREHEILEQEFNTWNQSPFRLNSRACSESSRCERADVDDFHQCDAESSWRIASRRSACHRKDAAGEIQS